ncbi:MAG: D-TA family PLP-dependent enzyme [Cyclobacteriaceae bacterium]
MSKTNHSWYTIHNIDQIDTPALVVYPQRVKENIRLLKNMIDDPKRLRPHVKTHKTKEATLLMMDAGINKFKCATIAEAEMLGICKARDVLLAYPVFGPKAKRLITLTKQYPDTRFSCLVDNLSSAKQISELAFDNDLTLDVFIDLNVGMNRTGINPGEEAVQLYEACAKLKGIKVVGFHAYDGHIREKNIEKRTLISEKTFTPVENMRLKLNEKGYKEIKIIMGGSPTFPIYAKHKDVECSPGTFVFWDKGYQESLPEQPFLPAALTITRVISLPGETKLCLDLGYKSVASENDLNHRVYFLNAPHLKIVKQSEEHLVVEVPVGHSWKVGDLLYGLPIHICPTCALYEYAIIVEENKATDIWKIIARDRKIEI